MAYTQLVRLYEVHASIHVLPPDILGEIFMFCVDSLIASYRPCIQPRAGVPPMLLCEVCRHWRAVMLSISTIWASVSRRNRMHTPKHLSLYKMWLARSRRAPLSLEIFELPKKYLDSVDEIISLLISEIHRWQFVWLRLEERDLFDRLLDIPDNAAPMLNGIVLKFSGNVITNGSDIVSTLPVIISKFPELRQLSLMDVLNLGLTLGPTPATIVPWQRLTHIKLSCFVTLSDCLDILECCSLAIDISFESLEPPLNQSIETITHSIFVPCLRSMTLYSAHCDPALLLRHLTLPVLTRMEIIICQTNNDRDYLVFNEFIRRTPQLKHLVLEDVYEVEHTLIYSNLEAVRRVPDVRFKVSEWEYSLLLRRAEIENMKFKLGPFVLPNYVGWTSRPNLELGNDVPRDWKRAFWDL